MAGYGPADVALPGGQQDASTSPEGAALLGADFRIAIVGPLPPPSGGMANQCRQLVRLLKAEGISVEIVQTNMPYRPAWVGGVVGLRALARLLPYAVQLWRTLGRCHVMHIFANSGWAWHLFATPAIVVARLRGVPVIVNYRGGNAESFLAKAPGLVRTMLHRAEAVITPSTFLQGVFSKHGIAASIIPNIVDLERFASVRRSRNMTAPHLIVTRHLEAIYDIPTAIRAFAIVRTSYPGARLTVAGTGPELDACLRLVHELGLGDSVRFVGRIDNDAIPELYREADIALNPSTVDNMPISILEAYASGVPVVTTDVGGIPHMAFHEKCALLVPPRDARAMADAVLRIFQDDALADRLVASGIEQTKQYAWPSVRGKWLAAYGDVRRRSEREHV